MPEPSKDRLLKLGARQDLGEQLTRCTDRVQGIIGSIQDALFVVDRENPYVIDARKVRNFAGELLEAIDAGGRIKSQIEQLTADLGEN